MSNNDLYCNKCGERHHPAAMCTGGQMFGGSSKDALNKNHGHDFILDQIRAQNTRINGIEERMGTTNLKPKVKEEFQSVRNQIGCLGNKNEDLQRELTQVINRVVELESYIRITKEMERHSYEKKDAPAVKSCCPYCGAESGHINGCHGIKPEEKAVECEHSFHDFNIGKSNCKYCGKSYQKIMNDMPTDGLAMEVQGVFCLIHKKVMTNGICPSCQPQATAEEQSLPVTLNYKVGRILDEYFAKYGMTRYQLEDAMVECLRTHKEVK